MWARVEKRAALRGEQIGLVTFLLYGLYSPGNRAYIHDGRGVRGYMTTACLKGLLALLDEERSPLNYVRESALELEVVTARSKRFR